MGFSPQENYTVAKKFGTGTHAGRCFSPICPDWCTPDKGTRLLLIAS
jgi:hypothetical protein